MPQTLSEITLRAHAEYANAESIPYEVYCAAINTLDPNVQVAFSIPGPLGHLIDHLKELVHDLIAGLKIGILDIIKALKQRDVFALLKGIGFNLKIVINAFVKLAHSAPKTLLKTLHDMEKAGWLEKIKSGAATVDDMLHAHPVLTRVGGVAIAALLLWLWLNATFTGHPGTDFDMTDVAKALSGHYDVAEIFASPNGLVVLAFSFTGLAGFSVGIEWLGNIFHDESHHTQMAMNFCLALIYTGLVHIGKKGLADKIKPYLFGHGDIDRKFKDTPEPATSAVTAQAVKSIAVRLAS